MCKGGGNEAGEHAGKTQADPWTRHVEDALQRKRRAFATNVGQVIASSFVLVGIGVCMRILRDGQRLVPAGQHVLLVAFYPLFSYMGYSERDHGLMVFRIFFFASTAGIALFVCAAVPSLMSVVYGSWICAPYRLLMSILWLDSTFVCWVNISLSCFIEVALYHTVPASQEVLPFTRRDCMLIEAIALPSMCFLAHKFQKLVTLSCRNAIELKASRTEACVLARVLNAVCDAVVQLDDELRVATKETKLVALRLHGPGRFVSGSDFLQYFQTSDRHQAFKEWLRVPPEDSDADIGFESKLRDSKGNLVDVEMFHVPFERAPGATHHVIGIREKGAESPAETTTRNSPAETTTRNMYGELPQDLSSTRSPKASEKERGWAIWQRQAAASSGDGGTPAAAGAFGSDSSADESVTSPRRMSSGEYEAVQVIDTCPEVIPEIDACPVLKFDATTFEIIGSSPGFSIGTHGAPRRSSSLANRLKHSRINVEFFRDVGENTERLRSRGQAQDASASFRTTMVYTPQGCNDRFRVDIRVMLESHCAGGPNARGPPQSPSLVATAVILSVTPWVRRRAPSRDWTLESSSLAVHVDLDRTSL